MKNISAWCPKWCNKNVGLFLIRVAVGVVFISHGWMKLSNMDGTIGFFTSLGFGSFLAYVVAIAETLGGLAVLLGVFVAPASIILAIIMIVAIVTVKWKNGFSGYEYELTLLLVLLGLSATGAGKCAISKSCECCDCENACKNTCEGCGDKNTPEVR